MRMTFDGLPVFDAVEELRNIARLGYPVPQKVSFNSLLNPLGPAPARGWFCLKRGDINKINLNGTHTAYFEDGLGFSATAHNLIIASEPQCLTPGSFGDANSVFLVEVSDYRHLLAAKNIGVAINAQYNVRAPAYLTAGGVNGFYLDSLAAGPATFTWAGLVQDLWLNCQKLGTGYAMPFTPDGTPEGWKFPGVSCYDALSRVLYRLGCAISWNPSAAQNPYTITRIGATAQATENALLTAVDKRKIFDRECLSITLGQVAVTARVYFHKTFEYYGTEETTPRTNTASGRQYSTRNVYQVDVATGATGADSVTIHPIWDDLPAFVDVDGVVQNAGALATRAAERAADYYRMLTGTGGTKLHKIYTGLLSTSAYPVKAVAWRQDLDGLGANEPGGLVTELFRHDRYVTRIGDGGEWLWGGEDAYSPDDQPPDMAPTYPTYPHLLQVGSITSTTPDANGFLDGFIEQYQNDGTFDDKEAVKFIDPNA